MNPPLITLDRIAVRLRDRWLLDGLSWCIRTGEQWLVTGPNGAGKTTLAKAVAGLLPVVQGRIHYHTFGGQPPSAAIAFVASDARRELWRQEQSLAYGRDFAGRFNETTTVREFLCRQPALQRPPLPRDRRLPGIAERCNLASLIERPLMTLSTGEMSRALIARQLLRRPKMLIMDEPFEGLDMPGRQALMEMLDGMAARGLPMLLITHRPEERLAATTHWLHLQAGHITEQAPVGRFLQPDAARRDNVAASPPTIAAQKHRTDAVTTAGSPTAEILIEMRAVTVRFGRVTVLERLDWTVRAGEHWSVTGPNGAGKSTLLKLITGDCLQVHANHIRLFGISRGPSQTLAQVRHQLGVVSHELATAYQKSLTALDVVCSGFFDSVGLYRYCDADQVETSRRQLRQMDIDHLARIRFNRLSQGQRQLVLIARAMVKSPRLLLLDEPLSGLDPHNRKMVLGHLTRIGRAGETGLIIVSHQQQEVPDLVFHHLALDRGRVTFCGLATESVDVRAGR